MLNCTLLSTTTHQDIAKRLFKHFLPYTKSVHSKHTCRFPTLLVTKHSRTFRDPRSIFPGPCRKPATLKYRDEQHLLAIYRGVYSTIAASILEYMFVTVMCCKEIAKKLFKHFLPLFCVCIRITVSCLHHCLANSRTFQDKTYIPGLSRSWKFYKHNSRTFQETWEPCRQVDAMLTAKGRITADTNQITWTMGSSSLRLCLRHDAAGALACAQRCNDVTRCNGINRPP